MACDSRSKRAPLAAGLAGVVVAETRLSQVDGECGRLTLRGIDIRELAENCGFEEVCALLWEGALPGPERARALRRELGEARVESFAQLSRVGAALEAASVMDALRGALASLPEPQGDPARVRTGITAAAAVFAAAWWCRQRGRELPAPDPASGHAADLLRLLRGAPAAPEAQRALDRYLLTVAEHGMNASTFSARVVASTGSDALSAVVAALGALKGPLHGGAPGPVLDMLEAIGEPAAAEQWIRAELAAGRRIMGLGHRVYRVRDPRAGILEQEVARLEAAGLRSQTLGLARAVERVAIQVLAERYPGRSLATNVEFYTAVLLDALGLHRSLFTGIFAAARSAGWLAHVEEQRADPRIIRPRQRYVGPQPAVASP